MTNINDEFIELYEYKIYRNGKIVNAHGAELKGWYFTYPHSHVTMYYGGKQHKVLRAKLIYELFNEEKVPKNYIIKFKDNNTDNCSLDNLYLMSRKEFARRNPHTNKRKLSCAAQKKIKDCYYDKNNKKLKDAPSTRELARIYKCSLSTIQKILKEGKMENELKYCQLAK